MAHVWIAKRFVRTVLGAIATTLPLSLVALPQNAWAETACGTDAPDASYRTSAGWIYICGTGDGLTYIGPSVGLDGEPGESVMLPAVPWDEGYQAIAGDVVYRINADEWRVLQLSDQPLQQEIVLEAATDTTPTLTGQIWQLQSVEYSNDEVVMIEQPNRYTIEFMADGSANVQADCNRAGASYTLDGNALTIDIGPTTRVACPPDSIDEEYLQDLGNAAVYSIRDGKLFIDLAADAGTMVFSPARSPQSDLTRQPWHLRRVQYNNDELVTIDDPSLYTLEFMPDGAVSVRADCNRAIGTYTQADKQLSIELGPTTLAACPPGSFSDRYLQDLQSAAGYFIEDGTLFIDLKVDGGTMVFAPAEQVLGRAELCTLVSSLPNTNSFGELLATLNINLDEVIDSQRALQILAERLDAEGIRWQEVLGGEDLDLPLEPWLIAALQLACDDE